MRRFLIALEKTMSRITPGSRRGTAIVLAVGTLVLLSVLTVIYWGIGRGDVRTSSVLSQDANVDATVGEIRDYLSQVIADDVLDFYVELGGDTTASPNQPVVIREATDYPFAGWPVEDVSPNTDPALWGTYSIPKLKSGDDDEIDRLGFKPSGGMAFQRDPSSEVITLLPSRRGDPWLAPHRPFALEVSTSGGGLSGSVLGGEWNKRARDWASISNFAPDGRFVNLWNLRNDFDIPSWLLTEGKRTGFSGSGGAFRGLSLLDANGGPTLTLDVPSAGGTTADPNVPAHWTMRQRNMFRPLFDDTVFSNPSQRFGDPTYHPYQYADADGDGFIDSRWFELVDLSASTQNGSPEDMIARSLLRTAGEYRYFIAARAVDLSGLINVNTAMDLRSGPTDSVRIGSTPADVDLRRILLMQDAANYYFGSPIGYNQLLQPTNAQPQTANYSGYDLMTAYNVGDTAYDVVRFYFEERVLPQGNFSVSDPTAQNRRNHFRNVGAAVPGRAVQISSSQSARAPQFGMESLAELLTYRGLNDGLVLSPLESATGGWFNINYGPLRDNRPLVVERQWTNVQTGQYVEAFANAWKGLDIRQLLTTFNVSRPIRSERLRFDPTLESFVDAVTTINGEYANNQFNSETRFVLEDAVDSTQDLFDGYAKALLPGWDVEMWEDRAQWGRSYANDPFKAALTAAHLAVNQKSLEDADGEIEHAYVRFAPSAATPTSTNAVELTSDLLPTQQPSIATTPPLVEVFGVKPQPFITEVASFIVYADAPRLNGGSMDAFTPPNPPTMPQASWEPTIDGTVSHGNADFLMACVAFQLHNPFDEDIKLWSASGDEKYFIEFDGKQFPLGESRMDSNYSVATDVQSCDVGDITLEANETIVLYALSQPVSEINSRVASSLTPPNSLSTSVIRMWIDDQFAVYDGVPPPPGAYLEAEPELIPVRLDSAPTIASFVDFFDGTQSEKSVITLWRAGDTAQDHVLVDRMRTATEHLDVSINGTGTIGGGRTYSGMEDPGTAPDESSVMLYASARRPNESGPTEDFSLPAWCVENKYSTSKNRMSASPPSGFAAAFNGVSAGAEFEIGPRSDLMFTETSGAVIELDPFEHALDSAARDADTWNSFGGSGTQGAHESNTIELPKYESATFGTASNRARVADLMLPLAIGPRRDAATFGSAGSTADDPAWTTLGEMVAMSLGYDIPPASNTLSTVRTDVDRGYLRLTDSGPEGALSLTSFIDDDADGRYDAGEVVVGPGVPVAYNILDVFTAMSDEYASHARGVPGLINVNTAPLEVLRALPLLSPPLNDDDWWVDPSMNFPLDSDNDIAATLFAYIHRAVVPTRRGTSAASEFYLSFGTDRGGQNEVSADPDPTLIGRGADPAGGGGRTGLRGLREDLGLGSIGELLAARFSRDLGTAFDPHSIDAIGRDGVKLNEEGIDSIRRQVMQGGGEPVDGLVDEHDERLAIVNAIADIATVRSDAFAVWFIVHGYARDDVEGLTNDDPMVPSVARRFLMIIDRSNVVRLGDKPEILLFREVPM